MMIVTQAISTNKTESVRLLVLPNIESYLQLLEPEMLLEKQKNEEVNAVMIASKSFHHCHFRQHGLSGRPMQKSLPQCQDKRKESMDHSDQQPPNKRIATDGPIGVVSTSSSPSLMQEDTAALVPVDDDVATSQSPGHIPHNGGSGSKRVRDKGDSRASKMAAILPQVWKDDLNSGQVLVSLFNLFGEGILSFIPAPEMSLFL
ncbi:hypothetical protein Ddye_016206 [Dipteronia dyeriana]|uniref:Uncharacterized protein n=1 Tax=Dipteronia dyeriana TaxID=168575 RepID=A0AAD9U775_9ROSI|nr:hypothetical protein Ddye_016206 [Dipteronia dyeriana]